MILRNCKVTRKCKRYNIGQFSWN